MDKKAKVDDLKTKLAQISTDVVLQEKTAKKIAVTNEKDVAKASEFLALIKGRIDRINKLRKFFTDPYVEQRKVALEKKREIDDMFDEQSKPLDSILNNVKGLVTGYAREQEEIAKKEEIRLQKLKDKRDEKAKEKGKPVDFTPAPTIERREATVKTESGKATTKKVWKFEIEAHSQLPKNVIDEVLYLANTKGIQDQVIRKMVASGIREIKGVRIYEDFDVSVSAK